MSVRLGIKTVQVQIIHYDEKGVARWFSTHDMLWDEVVFTRGKALEPIALETARKFWETAVMMDIGGTTP